MRRMLLRLVVLTSASLLLGPIGCNYGQVKNFDTGATLEGTVKYGNEPVLVAMVVVQGANGSAVGLIGDDGRYKITSVPQGDVNIGINVKAGEQQLMTKKMQGLSVPKVTNVPAKYTEPATSGIKTTINKGDNTYDIVIPK
jgi:hypothetical protein